MESLNPAFNLFVFKARWRDLCRRYGVDPVEGATEGQAVRIKGEQLKTTHRERMAKRVRRYAAAHPDRFPSRPFLDARASDQWWQSHRLWYYGPATRPKRYANTPFEPLDALGEVSRPPEVEAVHAVFEAAAAAEAERERERLSRMLNRRYADDEEREFASLVLEVLYEEQQKKRSRDEESSSSLDL